MKQTRNAVKQLICLPQGIPNSECLIVPFTSTICIQLLLTKWFKNQQHAGKMAKSCYLHRRVSTFSWSFFINSDCPGKQAKTTGFSFAHTRWGKSPGFSFAYIAAFLPSKGWTKFGRSSFCFGFSSNTISMNITNHVREIYEMAKKNVHL